MATPLGHKMTTMPKPYVTERVLSQTIVNATPLMLALTPTLGYVAIGAIYIYLQMFSSLPLAIRAYLRILMIGGGTFQVISPEAIAHT